MIDSLLLKAITNEKESAGGSFTWNMDVLLPVSAFLLDNILYRLWFGKFEYIFFKVKNFYGAGAI